MSTWEDNSWSRAIYTCYCVYSLLSLYWKFGKVGTMIIYLTWNIKKVALVVYYSTTTLSCCHVVMILYAPCFFTLVCSSQWEYLYVCLICFVWTCWKNIVFLLVPLLLVMMLCNNFKSHYKFCSFIFLWNWKWKKTRIRDKQGLTILYNVLEC